MMRRALAALLPLSLFFLVLGLKLEVIDHAGSDLPNWDQWDAEGLHVYLPWAEHRLGPADFLLPHNEHRVVLTKLLGFAELLVNGQWDARLQCVVNALLHCTVALLLFLTGRRHLAAAWQPVWFVLVGLLCGLPVAWQNVLGGFHSQQYFLLGLSFGTLCLLPFAAPWSRRWWAGAACAFLALFSMGSGLFAAAMVLPVALLRGWLLRHRPLIAAPTLVLCLGLVALGWLGRVEVSYHESLKAHSLGDFVLYTVHSLQWPFANQPWLAPLVWFPLVALAVVVGRKRATDAPAVDFPLLVLGLGGWVLLQILATAYARGAGAENPSSRYVDTLVIGTLANALALGWLGSRRLLPRWSVQLPLTVGWLAAIGLGLQAQSRLVYTQDLPEVRRSMTACEDNVRRYLATGDARFLVESGVPYPSVSAFRERIDLPALQAIMPVSVRRPLSLDALQPGPFQMHDLRKRQPAYAGPADASSAAKPTGLPPGVPPLEAARTWGNQGATGPGTWTSATIRLSRLAYLRFPVSGDLDGTTMRLVVLNSLGSSTLAAVKIPPGTAAGSWAVVEVGPLFRGNIVVQATVDDPARAFAFGEPVEVTLLSAWTARLVPHGRAIWQAAASGALLCLGLAGLGWRAGKALPQQSASSESGPRA